MKPQSELKERTDRERAIELAKKIIRDSKKVVIFTGAGISTESGIPDFRSAGGLWDKYDPSIYANYYEFLKDPSKFWQMEREVAEMLEKARPNRAHIAIAEFGKKTGKLLAVITQNVDMLHQKAGTEAPILELHGSGATASCVDCGYKIDRERLLEKMKNEKIPRCDKCGGYIKPDVVLFGEPLPMDTVEKAGKVTRECDCFIVVGSSLVVFPANQYPVIAKECGARLIIVNLDTTMYSELADVFIYGKAGEILPRILGTEDMV